jgi:hypothetical protein
MQIIYEPHPVTPERKAELRAQGYKILDAAFAPEELMAAAKEEKPRRGRPARVVNDGADN